MAYLGILFLGALDAAGYSIIAPVVPAIAAETGAGPGIMGALVATFAVGMAVGFAVAGHGVQLRHASSVLAGALALMALGCLGFVASESLAVLFVSRLLMGIGSGGLWIGLTFAALERFPGEEYRRMTGILAAYSIGGVAGAGLGGIGGIRAPFAAYLALVAVAVVVTFLLGAPRERARFKSDRTALGRPAFRLAAAGILLVAVALGSLEGPLPLHFGELLSQREIAALYLGSGVLIGASAALAGYVPPRAALLVATFLMVGGIALAGIGDSVPVWVLAAALAGAGVGMGEAGAFGVLLETVGVERIVLAMVVWSQVWAIGYLVGPAAGGGVAEVLGFGAIGLVPLAAAALVLASFARAPALRAAER